MLSSREHSIYVVPFDFRLREILNRNNMEDRSADQSLYRYDDLPRPQSCIRLLKILRGPAREGQPCPMLCKISIWYLNELDFPKFNAISYTWGDSPPSKVILLRKDGENHVFLAPENCERALGQAWNYDEKACYWIDCLCIDQRNMAEKGPQVSIMGDIYQRAQSVLACVGEHDDGSREILRIARIYTERSAQLRQTGNQDPEKFSSVDLQILKQELQWRTLQYDAFRTFLARPYFQRLWIYQELYLAQQVEICCENDHISINLLDNLACAVSGISSQLDPANEKLPPTRHLLNVGAMNVVKRSSLMELLGHVNSMGLLCRDIRDRCFGILAMVDWRGRLPIVPDYNKDKYEVAEELFRTVADTKGDKSLETWIKTATMIGEILQLHDVSSTAGFSKAIDCRGSDQRFPVWQSGKILMQAQVVKCDYRYGVQLQKTLAGWVLDGPPCKSQCMTCSPTQLPDRCLQSLLNAGDRTILPKSAQAGDWCIPLELESRYGNMMLVARQMTSTTRHELVGLGVWGPRRCQSLAKKQRASATRFELTLHIEDFLFVLCAAKLFSRFSTGQTDQSGNLCWDAMGARVLDLTTTGVCKSGLSFARITNWEDVPEVIIHKIRSRRLKVKRTWKRTT